MIVNENYHVGYILCVYYPVKLDTFYSYGLENDILVHYCAIPV